MSKTNELIIKLNEERATQRIEALEARRRLIFENLEAIKKAVEKLLRKAPTLADLEPFLGEGKKQSQIEAAAFEIWLRLEGDKMGINPAAAKYALGRVPDDVAVVVAAWDAYNEEPSEDPTKYWSAAKQAFKPIPVAEADKEAIRAEEALVAHSKEHMEMYQYIEQQTRIINFLNKHYQGHYTPAFIERFCPWLRQCLQHSTTHEFGHFKHLFEPRLQMFGTFGEEFKAFEEVKIRFVSTSKEPYNPLAG